MPRFDDYHRTVVGYHGTTLSAALRIVNRIEGFRASERDYDWLGRGIYFWEYGPDQAREWAELRRSQLRRKRNPTFRESQRMNEPIAVVASMIRLGFCFDLLDPYNVIELTKIHDVYRRWMELSGAPLPENNRRFRRLDCAVFDYAYELLSRSDQRPPFDTARGVYVPSHGRRVWRGSWVSREANIQLCVRNRSCILGTWLHYPESLGAADVAKALQDDALNVEPANPQGGDAASADAGRRTDRPDGVGEGDDAGASGPGEEEVG